MDLKNHLDINASIKKLLGKDFFSPDDFLEMYWTFHTVNDLVGKNLLKKKFSSRRFSKNEDGKNSNY